MIEDFGAVRGKIACVRLSTMLEFYPSVPNTLGQGDQIQGRPPGSLSFRQAANNNVGEPLVKTESGFMCGVCASCGRGICDKYYMRMSDMDYHENCLSCVECQTPLYNLCYTRECKLYCRSDYERIFGLKCPRCHNTITKTDMVQREAGLVYHNGCFVCCMCGQALVKGSHYFIRYGQPICRRDYENEMHLNSPQDDDLVDENRPRDGRRGPKRPRTILTSAQRRQFKAAFEVSPKPCRKVREALAKETGLSVRVVQVWFQNQRAKMKKILRKTKSEPGSEKEPKEERKTESPHSDHSHYMTALTIRDGESSNFPSATQPLNPNNPYSPDDAFPGHSGDSFCSSDLSIDGTEAGFEIAESENGGTENSHQGGSHSHHSGGKGSCGPPQEASSLSQNFHTAVHNPIDKLFMMQTSYFSVDHA